MCNVICATRNTHTYTHARSVYTQNLPLNNGKGDQKTFSVPSIPFNSLTFLPWAYKYFKSVHLNSSLRCLLLYITTSSFPQWFVPLSPFQFLAPAYDVLHHPWQDLLSSLKPTELPGHTTQPGIRPLWGCSLPCFVVSTTFNQSVRREDCTKYKKASVRPPWAEARS